MNAIWFHYGLLGHYYNSWFIADYIIDDFGNSIENEDNIYGNEPIWEYYQ